MKRCVSLPPVDIRSHELRTTFERIVRFPTSWVFVKFEHQRREKRTDRLLEWPPIG